MTLHARVVEALLAETAEHQAFADAYGRRRAKELAALASELADNAIVPNEQAVYVGIQRIWERQEAPAAVFLDLKAAQDWEAKDGSTATTGQLRRYVCVPLYFGASDEQ